MEKERLKIIFRNQRRTALEAFDIYKSNVLYGIEEETEPSRANVLIWYNKVLRFPDQITEETELSDFPTIPDEIKKYL